VIFCATTALALRSACKPTTGVGKARVGNCVDDKDPGGVGSRRPSKSLEQIRLLSTTNSQARAEWRMECIFTNGFGGNTNAG
jgi:hypothetical protein